MYFKTFNIGGNQYKVKDEEARNALANKADYEEGVWTPELYISSTSMVSLQSKDCRYKKVGNMVYIHGAMYALNSVPCYSINGLPFQARVDLMERDSASLVIFRESNNEFNTTDPQLNKAINEGFSTSKTSSKWIIDGWYMI